MSETTSRGPRSGGFDGDRTGSSPALEALEASSNSATRAKLRPPERERECSGGRPWSGGPARKGVLAPGIAERRSGALVAIGRRL